MRQLGVIFVFAFLMGCGASPEKDNGFGQVEQGYNSNPPPRLVCVFPMEACGNIVCVNLRWDNSNCGECGYECDVAAGEICHNYACKSIENFGFDNDVLNRGPVEYDVRKDLPRPNPVQTKP